MCLTIGTVEKNYDKDHPGQVMVKMNFNHSGGDKSKWLPVMSPYVGNGYDSCFMPETGDLVIVGFINDDANAAVVLGTYWNGKNEIKNMMTTSGHKITFNDNDKDSIVVKSKNGDKIELNDENETIVISSKNGKNKITVNGNDGKIDIETDEDITVKSGKGNISLSGNKIEVKSKSFALTSDGNLSMKGSAVALEGNTTKLNSTVLTVKGSQTDIESSGVLTLKGALIKMN